MAGNDKSPFKWVQLAALAVSAYSAYSQNRRLNRKDKRDQAQLAKYNAQFDKQLAAYEKSEFQPLDADALKQENIFEDLTVDTQAADYAREQFQQQQANIMQGMRGAVGSSGVAGLAQVMSNQAAQQSKQTQMTIGQQLQQNRRLQMQEQSRLNTQDRQIQLANMEGARQFEIDKRDTLMGISGQKIAGAQQAIAGNQAAMGQIWGAVGSIGGAAIGADWKNEEEQISKLINKIRNG